ncbi:MAG: bifunctional DNA primase/polymerase [Aerococcus sp.]|nr:bifunctional DNA primase/polymerase [Aerococcus sp.]
MNSYEMALNILTIEGVECIPIDQDKRPALAFKDTPITTDFIEEHATIYANSPGLAVLCRGLWCIDIDKGHGDGVNGFQSLQESEYMPELLNNLNTWQQKTPSGGRHLIYKKREGIPYRQKISFMPGVDIKAHHNNYFLLSGSRTARGVYQSNHKRPQYYAGELESHIFEEEDTGAGFVSPVLQSMDFSHLKPYAHHGKGKGKEAYNRIIRGESVNRNNDLFLASSYCKACGIPIDPLITLIGDIKNGDAFTESEFLKTVNSAQ